MTPKLNFENNPVANTNDIPEVKTFQPSVKNVFTVNAKRGCEWPEGHPDEPEFHFCNKERFEDKPYCLDHCAVAYVIPEKEETKQVTQPPRFI